MPADVIFETSNHDFVLVHPRVWKTMQTFVQRRQEQAEAGGILIGSYRGNHIEISSCTSPLPHDVRKRTLFDRLDVGHQKAASQAWKKSGGTDTYVGEWHTHPERHPAPSSLDRKTWRTVIGKQEYPVVFIIIGTDTVCAFKGSQNSLEGLRLLGDDAISSEFNRSLPVGSLIF